MAKVGVQLQSGVVQDFPKVLDKHPAAILLLGNAATLDLAKAIRARSPQTVILLRAQADNWALDAQWTADFGARSLRFAEPFQKAGCIDFLLPANEPVVSNDVEARLLNNLQVSLAQSYRAAGYQTGAYTFPEGNPPYNLWPYLQGGIDACDGWLFLHEYGAPALQTDAADLSLRHRKVPGIAVRKVGILECGIDLGIVGKSGGYRALPDNGRLIEDYLDQLSWWEGELAKDPYVKFATLFGYAMEHPWETFDVAAVDTDRAKFIAWLGSGVPVAPPPPPPPVTPPVFAFKAYPLATVFPVTQGFGENPANYAKFGLPGHEGIDYGCPEATPVQAVAAGTVVHGSDPATYGSFIRVNHADGWQTIYAHLSFLLVPQGATVAAGERIGLSGATGNVTGPHLHFSLRRPGYTYTDAAGVVWPQGYFDPTALLRAVTPGAPPQEAQVRTALQRQNASWLAMGVIHKADSPSAFELKAKELGLGFPLSNEYRDQQPGEPKIAGQVFGPQGVALETVEGEWALDKIKPFAVMTGEPWVPAAVTPPGGVPTEYSFPAVLTAYGAIGEEGKASAGNSFYRLTGATVKQGVSAFMVVEVYGKGGIPAIGVQIVNLFPDGHGEVIETDGQGIARFQFGASSAFSNPGQGPFTIFTAVGASKDQDTKMVSWAARTSDIVKSLGDYRGAHTEFSIQFVEQG